MKWKTWHYRFSIKHKIISIFLSISLLSVLLMGFCAQYYYGRATKQDFFNMAFDASTRINYQMDLYLQQLAQSTYSTIAGPVTVDNLFSNHSIGLIQSWLIDRSSITREQTSQIVNILNQYIEVNHPEIIDTFLVSKDKEVISTTGVAYDSAMYQTQKWYQDDLVDKLTILPTNRTYFRLKSGYPVVSLIIPIYSTDTVKLIGELVLNISLSQIKTILGQSQLGQSGYFFIVSADNRIVYHPNPEWEGLPISQTNLNFIDFSHPKDVKLWHGENFLLANATSPLTHWKVVAIVPMAEMANGLHIARDATLIAMTLLVLAILSMVPVLSAWFVRPIQNLKQLMQQVQAEDLSVMAESHPGRDEIQLLIRNFNRMTKRLSEQMETIYKLRLTEVQMELRQKEAMIQALQNQINPHLLYNTLDIMKSIAFMENVPRIEKISGNLASLYRYTASFSNLEVRLEDELSHLSKYLEIVHIRFSKHFHSEIYVNERYLSCKVIKLTLQPIVENAVKYAVEPKQGKAAIIINAYETADDLVIEIADNGSGMDMDSLQALCMQLSRISDQGGTEYTDNGSLGIINVHSRLVLKYGSKYGLTLRSFPGRGMVISVCIPLRRN